MSGTADRRTSEERRRKKKKGKATASDVDSRGSPSRQERIEIKKKNGGCRCKMEKWHGLKGGEKENGCGGVGATGFGTKKMDSAGQVQDQVEDVWQHRRQRWVQIRRDRIPRDGAWEDGGTVR